jgi:hypothetical protein
MNDPYPYNSVVYTHKYGTDVYLATKDNPPALIAVSLILDNYQGVIEEDEDIKTLLTFITEGRYDEAREFYNENNEANGGEPETIELAVIPQMTVNEPEMVKLAISGLEMIDRANELATDRQFLNVDGVDVIRTIDDEGNITDTEI